MDKKEMEDKIKAMEEELKQLKEELNKKLYKKEKGYFKPRANKEYYCVNFASVLKYDWYDANFDNVCYNTANCFETKEETEKVLFEQTLFRKIRRFRDTYDEEEVDWSDNETQKYYIHYDYKANKLRVNYRYYFRDINIIYFTSKEVAEMCLEEFRDELEKYFTGNY